MSEPMKILFLLCQQGGKITRKSLSRLSHLFPTTGIPTYLTIFPRQKFHKKLPFIIQLKIFTSDVFVGTLDHREIILNDSTIVNIMLLDF